MLFSRKMRHGDNHWQQEWKWLQLDNTHKYFISACQIEGTLIYRYGNKKIQQFNYLVNRGVNLQQDYMFDRILFSLLETRMTLYKIYFTHIILT